MRRENENAVSSPDENKNESVGSNAFRLFSNGIHAVGKGVVNTAIKVKDSAVLAASEIGNAKRVKERIEEIRILYPTDEALERALERIVRVSRDKFFNALYNPYLEEFNLRSLLSQGYKLNSPTDDLINDINSSHSAKEIATCIKNYLRNRQNHGYRFCHQLIMRHLSTLQTNVGPNEEEVERQVVRPGS